MIKEKCWDCGGDGKQDGGIGGSTKCFTCNGTGKLFSPSCPACNGSGFKWFEDPQHGHAMRAPCDICGDK